MDIAIAPARTSSRYVTYLQAALTLTAATVFGLRTMSTAGGQSLVRSGASQGWGTLAVGTATAATMAAAVLLLAQRRRPAAAALVVALALELLVLGRVASPPYLVTAPALALVLALFAMQGHSRAGGAVTGGTAPSWRGAAGVVGLALMVPVGVLYLLLSGLVIPAPAIYAVYLLYGLLFAAAALFARWRSVWALAVPPTAVALWFLVVTFGGEYLGWQA
jgi:hypothetical protein